MWPRLQMMKAMLRPGGVLAICIDFRELFRLGQMLDELFGEKNRLGVINWQRTYSPSNDAEHVAVATEYVLVYAKAASQAKTGLLPREDRAGASNPDADPVEWTDAPATGSNAKAHKAMVYGIQSPFTGEIHYPPAGSAWRQGQDRNLEQLRGWGCKFVLKDIDDAAERAAIIGVPVEEAPDVKAIMLGEPPTATKRKATALLEAGVWPRFYFLSHGQGRPRLKKYVHEPRYRKSKRLSLPISGTTTTRTLAAATSGNSGRRKTSDQCLRGRPVPSIGSPAHLGPALHSVPGKK